MELEEFENELHLGHCQNKIRRCSILLVACMALLLGCTDDGVNSGDHRDKMVGTYVGDSEYRFSANGGEYVVDTVYLSDTLSVAKCGDESLTIGYRNQLFEVVCTEAGKFSRDNYPHGGCDGKYFDDSLYFNYNESFQGRSVTYNFKGNKQ